MKRRSLWLAALGLVVVLAVGLYLWSEDAWWQSVTPDMFLSTTKSSSARGTPSESVVNFLTHSVLTDLQVIESGSEAVSVSGLAGSNGVPPPPQDLFIQDLRIGDSLRLAWTLPVDDSRSAIEVWRGNENNAQSLLATLPPDTRSFTDSSLKTGQVYEYALAVRSGEAVSAKGAVVSGFPTDTTPPSPPRSLILSRLAEGSGFRLSWLRAEISEPSTYRIWRSEKPDERGVMLAALVDGLSYDDTTAVSGAVYWYRVTAIDGAGNESAALRANGYRRSSLLGSPLPPPAPPVAKPPSRR